MKKFLLSALLLGILPSLYAQDEIEANVKADAVSQYVWRGLHLGSVSLQPELSVGWKGLSLSAWGSVGLSDPNDAREIDLTASYALGQLSFGITDYWAGSPEPRYFLYDAHSTSHVFEAFAAYDFGFLNAAWYTIFAGNDGLNSNGERAYSSYFELSVPFTLSQCQWTATAGMVPFGTSYYETSRLAVTNLTLSVSKDLPITQQFSLPLFAQLTANPADQSMYFIFGVTLQP